MSLGCWEAEVSLQDCGRTEAREFQTSLGFRHLDWNGF